MYWLRDSNGDELITQDYRIYKNRVLFNEVLFILDYNVGSPVDVDFEDYFSCTLYGESKYFFGMQEEVEIIKINNPQAVTLLYG